MLGTGLRPSEAIALKGLDFDAANASLYVQRTYNTEDGYKEPKTRRGRRLIKLREQLVKLLLDHQDAAPPASLIFPSLTDTPLNIANLTERHYNLCLARAGLGEVIRTKTKRGKVKETFKSGFTLYDLRHMHVTLLLKAGILK